MPKEPERGVLVKRGKGRGGSAPAALRPPWIFSGKMADQQRDFAILSAMRRAAIIDDGLAIPLPAMSKAVP